MFFFFFTSRRGHTSCSGDWISDVCSPDLWARLEVPGAAGPDAEPLLEELLRRAVSALSDALVRTLGRLNIALYRRSGGRLFGRIGKTPILLLTTKGRRSGAPRTAPLPYLRDGERLAVVASL